MGRVPNKPERKELMVIQSLSIVVPNKNCVNDCKFCVSKMHCDSYPNNIDENLPYFGLQVDNYMKRLAFARDNGCNTVMLTGTSEPQQNRKFLAYFGMMQRMLKNPFKWVEMQTTGVLLDHDYLVFLRNHVGVDLISLSVSSLNDQMNNGIIGTPANCHVHLRELCAKIKHLGFSLRLSLNLTEEFSQFDILPQSLFKKCKELGADQVTLRVLYSDDTDSEQSLWIRENAMPLHGVLKLQDYVLNGKLLGVLPHGAKKYSVDGLCVVIDHDCMDKKEKTDENYKYLILQPDCHLYSAWDDPTSLIF